MRTFTPFVAIILCLFGQANAADIPQTPDHASQAEDVLNCAFVTTDCETCVVDATGKPTCSSTGIACAPKVKRCLIPKK
jgi:hypothetical protein